MKSFLKPRLGYLFFLMIFGFFSCAPQSNSSNPTTTEISLPTRPSTEPAIFSRSLLYKNDARVSYCEILDNKPESYSGMRDTQLEPLASLSKIMTSAWAIESLGIDYRFKSEWYLKPVPGRSGIFDAYLRTNFDPVLNTEKLLYFMSELRSVGVLGLRELTIDETTRVYISVLSVPHLELKDVPVPSEETKENLKLILNSKNWASRTQKARDHLISWAMNQQRSLKIPDTFSVEKVVTKNSNQISKETYPYVKTILSSPLFKYLKNMNVYSNNYIADALFELLGGADAFKNFQKNILNINFQDLQINTGSGLAINQNGVRKDNVGSCFSVIRTLSFLRQKSEQAQLNLGHILLNPTQDLDGTFTSNNSYNNAAVLKTGRLFEYPAFNLAGFVATSRGTLSFAFLGHDFSEAEAQEIEQMRSEMFDHVFKNYQTSSDYVTLPEYDIFL